MDFRILGPLQLVGEDGPQQLGGPKEQLLLALLIVNAGSVVTSSRMIEEMWAESQPKTAVKTLRSHISRIRRRVGPDAAIEKTGSGYQLLVDRSQIDATRFEERLDTALSHKKAGSLSKAVLDLTSALAEWRGSPLTGLENHEFARLEATRLESKRVETLDALMSCELALGRHQHVLADLQTLVATYPHHEAFWGHLMLALYRSGRQADSLSTYTLLRHQLAEELGIVPSIELRDLEEKILLQDESLLLPSQRQAAMNMLPTALDTFVGREREIADLQGPLLENRCLTLTGAGGSGKTRLAVELAQSLLSQFPNGANWVELATILDPDGLTEHILTTFGEPGSHATDPNAILFDLIRGRELLLVLDNCEHLIEPVADLAIQLLRECPDLTILATSREPLGIPGESIFRVPPLTIPKSGDPLANVKETEAVRLLTERVHNFRRDFTVDKSNADLIVAICRKLDGIPLAIELAAARLRTMSVADLAQRIDDRLGLLTKGGRTAPARHQTLRATIEWSYELLTPKARKAFRATGVFAGPWTFEGAKAIAMVSESDSEAWELIDELVQKSLLERREDNRFRLLQIIREFAFERSVISGEAPTARRRHRDWYLALAKRTDPELRGPEQQRHWLSLDQDQDNLRAAMQWSLDTGDVDKALEMVADLGYYWLVRGYWQEAHRWLERGLEKGGDPLWRARAIVGETIIDAIRVNFASVEPLIQEAMATLETGDDEGARMRATLVAGVGKQLRGDPEAYDLLEAAHSADSPQYDAWTAAFAARYLADKPGLDAIALLTESYRQFMELGDSWNAAFSMYYLSGWYLSVERYQESEEAARVARDMADAVGDVIWSAHATRNLGIAALQKGHLVEARTYIDEALDRLGAIGDDACIATLSRGLATIALKDGEWMKSLGLMTKAIRSSLRLGSPISAGVTLWHAARLAASAEDGVEAARLAAVAERTLGTKIELLGAPLIREIESMDDQINEIVLPSQRHDIADAVADLSFDAAMNEALNWCLARLNAARASA